jgi:hypothetical protein
MREGLSFLILALALTGMRRWSASPLRSIESLKGIGGRAADAVRL